MSGTIPQLPYTSSWREQGQRSRRKKKYVIPTVLHPITEAGVFLSGHQFSKTKQKQLLYTTLPKDTLTAPLGHRVYLYTLL